MWSFKLKVAGKFVIVIDKIFIFQNVIFGRLQGVTPRNGISYDVSL